MQVEVPQVAATENEVSDKSNASSRMTITSTFKKVINCNKLHVNQKVIEEDHSDYFISF